MSRRGPSWRILVVVGTGGAVGTLLRFGIGELLGAKPTATLTVNLVGAFLLGLLLGWAPWQRPGQRLAPGHVSPWQAFLGTGMLGGFTTYSALALDLVTMPTFAAVGYGLGTVVAGAGLAFAGIVAGRRVRR